MNFVFKRLKTWFQVTLRPPVACLIHSIPFHHSLIHSIPFHHSLITAYHFITVWFTAYHFITVWSKMNERILIIFNCRLWSWILNLYIKTIAWKWEPNRSIGSQVLGGHTKKYTDRQTERYHYFIYIDTIVM